MSGEELPRGHRGTGVLHTGGDFRVSGISISIGDDGLEVPNPVTIEIRTDTFGHWLHVAQEARDRSAIARAEGIDAGPNDAFLSDRIEFRRVARRGFLGRLRA